MSSFPVLKNDSVLGWGCESAFWDLQPGIGLMQDTANKTDLFASAKFQIPEISNAFKKRDIPQFNQIESDPFSILFQEAYSVNFLIGESQEKWAHVEKGDPFVILSENFSIQNSVPEPQPSSFNQPQPKEPHSVADPNVSGLTVPSCEISPENLLKEPPVAIPDSNRKRKTQPRVSETQQARPSGRPPRNASGTLLKPRFTIRSGPDWDATLREKEKIKKPKISSAAKKKTIESNIVRAPVLPETANEGELIYHSALCGNISDFIRKNRIAVDKHWSSDSAFRRKVNKFLEENPFLPISKGYQNIRKQ